MLQLEEAQARVLALINPLPSETVPILESAGRFASESLHSPIDLPPFDNSAMDGYAVRAEDLKAATTQAPVALRLIGQVTAGSVFAGELSQGQCVRLFTGSPLPPGADAVIMQEDTHPNASQPESPLMLDSIKPWENVRLRGEDVRQGDSLVSRGERLTIGTLGLLAAVGYASVPVTRRPIVGLLATGTELVEPNVSLKPGQIYESNRLSLALLTSGAGAHVKIYPLVPDEMGATRAALARALEECDVVITSGGVSVGQMDLVKAAFEELKGELDFWRVAIKPGKPFALGVREGKLLFALPGNPVSAFVTFLLLARPALLRFQGATVPHLSSRPGYLAEALLNRGDRRHFIRVWTDRAGHVAPSGPQASHRIKSLAHSNGLVDVPPNTTLPAGTPVSVLTWE